jgi:predicted flap endonuclease-1-like 5' DNA nuclease
MPSIDAIEGVGVRNLAKLRRAKCRTTEALLKKGATRRDRTALAAETGLLASDLLEWVNRADLMRIKGIGTEYSDLLEEAGVDTIKVLRRRNAANLTKAIEDINAKKRSVRRLPTPAMVGAWVEAAKKLEPVVSY